MGTTIVTGALLASAEKNFRALFFKTLEQSGTEALAMVKALAMEVTSTSSEENYRWLGDVPGMQEWTGDRVLQRLRAAGYRIVNKKWANGIVVEGDELEDGKLGLVKPRIMGLANKAGVHKKNLLIDLIAGGATGDCYDGKKFFAADHEEGSSGAQSNKFNLALSAANYATVRAAMKEYVNDQGDGMDVHPTHLWCNTSLEGTAREILTAERDSNGKTNVWRNTAEVMVLPHLGSTTMWGLADLSRPLKPLILQTRRPVRFRAQDKLDAEGVFMRDEYRFGADGRWNAGYGLWQLMVLGKA